MSRLRDACRAVIMVFLSLAFGAALSCRPANAPEHADDAPRVVALSPGVAQILRDLDLGERLVGRHAFDHASPRSIPVVGDQNGIDYETLLRTRPSHVLLERGARDIPPRLSRLAEDRGWRLETLPMLTLRDIREATLALPGIVGEPGAQARAESLVGRLNEAASPDAALSAKAGRCLPLFWTDPVGVAGPGSFHVELLAAMGVRTVPDDGAPYITLDVEDVRRLAPDSILLFVPGADADRLAELLGPLHGAGLRAIREGRIAVIDHPLGLLPSTGMIGVAEQVREALHVWPALATEPPDAAP